MCACGSCFLLWVMRLVMSKCLDKVVMEQVMQGAAMRAKGVFLMTVPAGVQWSGEGLDSRGSTVKKLRL